MSAITIACIVTDAKGSPKANSKKSACGLRVYAGKLVTTYGNAIVPVTVNAEGVAVISKTQRIADVPRKADGSSFDFETLDAHIAPRVDAPTLAKLGYVVVDKRLVAKAVAPKAPKGRKAAEPKAPAKAARPAMVKAPAAPAMDLAGVATFVKAMSPSERAALVKLLTGK